MSEQAWGQFRSGVLRRLEFDRIFGVQYYPKAAVVPSGASPRTGAAPEVCGGASAQSAGRRSLPPAQSPQAPPVQPQDTDYAPSEVAGLGLPVPETAAGRAAALAQLKCYADACTACALHQTRTKGVFGTGRPGARLMVIGEAPGKYEDLQGEPFVGEAGALLDRQIKAIHLAREDVYICNTIKCRPPGNRDPRPEEKRTCKPFLVRQIQLVRPEMILAVGAHAARWVLGLGDDVSVGRMRGRVHDCMGVGVVVTYHPAYLLREGRRSPAYPKAWDDLQRVRDALGLTPGDRG